MLALEAVVRGPRLAGAIVVPLAPPDAPPPEPAEPVADAELAGLRVGGHFNPDLASHASIPREPGVYRVRVRLGEAVSKEITVEVVAESDAGPAR